MSIHTTEIYGGKFQPQENTRCYVRVFDMFLNAMIERGCNNITKLAKRLRLTTESFMALVDQNEFTSYDNQIVRRFN